ncbi:MAG: hypothetical protein HY331_10245 [Chloroflexi bacterium]|nr:hypothetical protein [Chloroflexota bacterium]
MRFLTARVESFISTENTAGATAMRALTEYGYSANVLNIVGPAAKILEYGRAGDIEVFIASLALSAIDGVQEGRLSPQEIDQAFTLLDVYLTDNRNAPPLSEEAQELLFEAGLLHDYGAAFAPDLDYVRRLAEAVLKRRQSSAAE